MARPKQEFCSNCNGENPKCKYKETGRKCRVGKAKGKAKGKAISKETIEKRDNYDSLLGDLLVKSLIYLLLYYGVFTYGYTFISSEVLNKEN